MIYPQVDYQEWAERYKIRTTAVECPTCKKEFQLTVPVAMKGYRGLEMADHGCGPKGPFRVVPVDEDKIAIWESIRPAKEFD